ncbi:MAG: carbohydrate ABC transporter permease [Treponemataceae bacterium]
MKLQTRSRFRPVAIFVKVILAALFLAPFYITLCYSVKTREEITKTGLAFPTIFHLSNFTEAMEMANFFLALKNSILTTVPAVIVLTLICTTASYIIARKNNRFYNAWYYLFLGTILIPFQTLMLPLYVNLKKWHLINTLAGFSLTRIGFLIPFSILIMTGFVKTVPVEIEQAAQIDGAGRYRIFFMIVSPLLKPIIATAVILNSLYLWNDFQTAILILQKAAVRTLPLTQFFFFSENSAQLNLAFALFTLSMTPILLLYFVLQKYITEGLTIGAVKG